MFSLILSKANIRFAEQKLVWRTYIAAEALQITKSIEIIDKKEFAVAVLNADDETFIVYVVTLAKPITMPIHPSCKA